ncbi:MAG: class III poly(R)-hydroxyalkanoic acid synthase subunit PhaC [Gammaproteobacteria bacterium]|nr:MAG: class III poly(R)-hydroxyalkanoic acid synthase subunit PhaC [Gammaproteobacteria bacterium]
MTPSALDPAAVQSELLGSWRRLAAAIAALTELPAVGPGCSARDEAWREDGVVLYRYRPLGPPADLPPVLICYALVNRPGMLDLQPDRSLIRGLLARGLTVWLIDWGDPAPADRYRDLDDYINGYLDRCVDVVCAAHGVPAVNLMGVCQGGTLALCYTALHGARVRNLITMVTPVDFHTPDNLLTRWARGLDAGRMAEVYGNIPGALLNAAFLALRPLRLSSGKYARLAAADADQQALATFLRMERWILDSPDQAGAAFAQFIRWFFQENRLINGGLELAGRPVELGQVRCPILNVYATRDHLVPPAASLALEGRTGSADCSSHGIEAGHIGIYVGGQAPELLPGLIAGWCSAR